jgi:hypothetical protein
MAEKVIRIEESRGTLEADLIGIEDCVDCRMILLEYQKQPDDPLINKYLKRLASFTM